MFVFAWQGSADVDAGIPFLLTQRTPFDFQNKIGVGVIGADKSVAVLEQKTAICNLGIAAGNVPAIQIGTVEDRVAKTRIVAGLGQAAVKCKTEPSKCRGCPKHGVF